MTTFSIALDRSQDKAAQVDCEAESPHSYIGLYALDRVVLKFRHHDIPVEIVGLNEASATLVDRLGIHNKEGASLASGH